MYLKINDIKDVMLRQIKIKNKIKKKKKDNFLKKYFMFFTV